MPVQGFPDYSIGFVGAIGVPNGGTGLLSVDTNALLLGNLTGTLKMLDPGTSDQILTIDSISLAPAWKDAPPTTPSGPAGGDLGSTYPNPTVVATHLTLPLPVAQGGSGSAAPALIAGTAISITGFWPDETINNTSAYASLADPLPVAHGGTGTASPDLVAGTSISITGAWPGQTINNTSAFASLADPLPVAHGGTGTANGSIQGVGGLTLTADVTGNHDIAMIGAGAGGFAFGNQTGGAVIRFTLSGGDVYFETATSKVLGSTAPILFTGYDGTPTYMSLDVSGNLTLTGSLIPGTPLAIAHGGTATATPALVAGANIAITGSWPDNTIALSATPSVTSLTLSGTGTNVTFGGADGNGKHATLDDFGNVVMPSGASSADAWAVKDTNAVAVLTVTTGGAKTVALAGVVSSYDGLTTAGRGLPPIVGVVDLTGQTAVIAATTFYTPAAAGRYRISAEIMATGGAATDNIELQISFTQNAAGTTISLINITVLSAHHLMQGTCILIYADASTAIQYETVTSGTVPAGYDLHIVLEAM